MKTYNYCIYIENFHDREEKVLSYEHNINFFTILSYGHNISFFTMMKEYFSYVKNLKFDENQIDKLDFDDTIEYNTINKSGDALYLKIKK